MANPRLLRALSIPLKLKVSGTHSTEQERKWEKILWILLPNEDRFGRLTEIKSEISDHPLLRRADEMAAANR
jgi:hypothetical protein